MRDSRPYLWKFENAQPLYALGMPLLLTPPPPSNPTPLYGIYGNGIYIPHQIYIHIQMRFTLLQYKGEIGHQHI